MTTLTRKPKPPFTEEEELMLDRLADIKTQIKELTEEERGLQSRILDAMARNGIKTFRTKHVAGTFVQGTRLVYNEAKLAKRVGAKVWKKITTPVLDSKKISKALGDGLLSADDLSACSTEEPNKPYVRITKK